MDLPQVQVIGAEGTQARLELGEQVSARGIQHDGAAAQAEPGLAREHHAITHTELAQQGAEQRLRGAVAVHGRGVDERAAGIEEGGELLLGLDLVDLAAEGHGAEPEARDGEPGGADTSLLHARTLVRGSERAV